MELRFETGSPDVESGWAIVADTTARQSPHGIINKDRRRVPVATDLLQRPTIR